MKSPMPTAQDQMRPEQPAEVLPSGETSSAASPRLGTKGQVLLEELEREDEEMWRDMVIAAGVAASEVQREVHDLHAAFERQKETARQWSWQVNVSSDA